MNFSLFFIGILFLGSVSELNAQTRPYDNGEISGVESKALQLDNYYSRTNNPVLNTDTYTGILRYGLSKNYELQMTWTGQKDNYATKRNVSESTNIGLKAHLSNDTKYLPALALIASANLTFDPKNTAFSPTLNLLFNKSVNGTWCVNGNYQVTLDELKNDLTTGYSFNIEAAVTNWQSTYIGLTGMTSSFISESKSYDHYLEIGGLFWLFDGVTLYPFYDIGLTEGTGDIFNIGALFTVNK